jgi:hypothetical protein
MWKRLSIIAVALLASAAPLHAQASLPLAFQVGGGFVLPLGEFADVAGNGFGASVGTGFQLAPNLGLYAGYSWTRFESDLVTGDVTDSGISAGLSFVLPQLAASVFPWVGAGVVLHRLDIGGVAQQPSRGDPGLGLAGGVLIPLSAAVYISPSVGFVRYMSEFPGRAEIAVSHLSLGLALNLSPW